MNERKSGDRHVIFYHKEDCHLCEEMDRQLAQFIAGQSDRVRISVEKRDIEENQTWFDRYREYIPVLVVDNEEVCHYFMDHDALQLALSQH